MSKSNPSPVVAIAGIALAGIVGVYGAMFIGFANGFLPTLTESIANGEVPGCPVPLKTVYTNFVPVDRFLQNVIPFFCVAIDGAQTWAETLSNWYLTAQLFTAWILLSLEGRRRGNQGKLVSWTGLVGVIFQTISYTLTIPCYLVMHLLTSPLSWASTPQLADAVTVDSLESELTLICASMALMSPSVLMALPSPDMVSMNSHYNFIAFWQGFPIWHTMFRYVLRLFYTRGEGTTKTAPANNKPVLWVLEPVYRFALVFAVVTHIAVLAIALTPASVVSSTWHTLFSEVGISTLLPGSLLSPPSVAKVNGIMPDILAPLAAYFLKYDVQGGNAAMVIWAWYLRARAGPFELRSGIVKVLVWTLFGGTIAPAVVMLWERDKILLEHSERKKA